MNTTKRKFNALVQGIGSRSSTPTHASADDTTLNAGGATSTPRRSTSSLLSTTNSPSGTPSNMTVSEDLVAKRRRLHALTEKNAAATNTIKSVGGTGTGTGGTKVSNVVLKKWAQTSADGNFNEIAPSAAAPAAKFAPNDRFELLKRLATFQEITDWTPKPDKVGEFEWAKRGWVCQGKERVRCTLCSKELLVNLNKREVDGKDVPVVMSSDAEEALKDKYADLIVSAHQEDCLWRRQGCDDSLLRLSLTNAKASYETLRQRYDELCERKHFLPYEFNLRFPEGLDLDTVLSQLPDDFFTNPPPKKTGTGTGNNSEEQQQQQQKQQPNRVALALALLGWQGLSNPRLGPVPNSASCHTCLRRLGLWMFKSKEVGPGDEVIVPAPMDHLDPTREHRFFCPWKNPQTQRWSNATKKKSSAGDSGDPEPAWRVLVQVIKNDAYLRGALDDRPKSRAQRAVTGPGQDKGPSTPGTSSMRGDVSLDAPSTVATEELDAEEEVDDEKARNAKDKTRWARLRKVKSLFESKGGKKLRQSLSRPGTSQSNASGASRNTGKE